MHISSYSNYATGAFDMDTLHSSIHDLQQQLDTQQRVNTPSDDPVASTQILQLSQSNSRNAQFINNINGVNSQLTMVDTALGNSTNLLSNLKSLVVQAGNGALDTNQLKMLQQQVDQRYTELMGYANSTDGRGDYLFGGNKVSAAPFVADAGMTATYNGDTGQRVVQITDSRSLPVTQIGSQVFGDGSSPTAVFDALQTFSKLLGQDPKPVNYMSQLDSIMSRLDNAQSNILTAQAAVGAAEQENNNTLASNQSMSVQYQSAIGNLQNLDLPKAISDFTMAQTSLQYSQLAYSKVTQLSLFNYLQ
jgi:flagellar hook-associated protein 3 FlgL